jgi:hypothetical protein
MFPLSRIALPSLLVALLFAATTAARIPDPVNPHLRLAIFNDAAIPADTLTQAESRASFVLAQSGIELDWINCGRPDPSDFSPHVTPCSSLAWPHQLSVRILPRGRSIHSDIFGQAFLDESGSGVYSNVYYNNLAANPEHTQLPDADMLGLVIAHEVGHLLLGSNSHSSSGLMQARWNASALQAAIHNTLLFAPAQSAALRSRLSIAAQTPSHSLLLDQFLGLVKTFRKCDSLVRP